MKYVSLSSLLTLLAACYVIHSVWTFIDIFIPPKCTGGERCFKSYLSSKPVQDLVIWTSIREYPYSDSVHKVYTALNFDYFAPHEFFITIQVPKETRKNGTLYMHVALLDAGKLYNDFDHIRQTETLHTIPIIAFIEPQAATFKLLNSEVDKKKEHIYGYEKPYSHIRKIVPISIYADTTELPAKRLPSEMYPYIRVRHNYFLPILLHNVLKSRLSHLQLVESDMSQFNVTVEVAPASFGIVRLALHIGSALEHLKSLGFTEKDVDDVKGIFADTNLYLLSATIVIATCHLLFDFLAFKNDVSFWRRKQSMAGLSSRTVLWRAFSQCVIFMYLVDEKTSLLVLVPAGISAIIELWKAKKVLRLRVRRKGWRVSVERATGGADAGELHTARADAEAMKYLSRLLYPLCAAGAVYSLMYEPQKSWYSWALHSVVNGVYAFGFLFMLPQLFVNYRLRSVAALPWRAFMYKAFNTFIDDVFAFVITMPTAHRVACFRDDLVFLVYLYQRWLYPVDASRIDTGVSMDEAAEVPTSKNAEHKKED